MPASVQASRACPMDATATRRFRWPAPRCEAFSMPTYRRITPSSARRRASAGVRVSGRHLPTKAARSTPTSSRYRLIASTRARLSAGRGRRKFSSWKQKIALPPTARASTAISAATSFGDRSRRSLLCAPWARASRRTVVIEQKLQEAQQPRPPLTGTKGMRMCRVCGR